MNISEQIDKMYNKFLQESNYETKTLLTKCYEDIKRSLKIFMMVKDYPDLHNRIATYTYDANGILISKKVNSDKNAILREYFKPIYRSGVDAMEVYLHIFKNDNGLAIFSDPPFIYLGDISQKEFWINDKLRETIDEAGFSREIVNKIYSHIDKLRNDVKKD